MLSKHPAKLIRHVAAASVLVLACSLQGARASDQDDALARTIVEKADQVRFPSGGFEVAVAISNLSGSGAPEVRKYKVMSKGNENTIVFTTEPASERGQILLMKGRDLWVFVPSASQPVRLPLTQRLTGQVANGDLARANFAGDYNPKILRTEKIDGDTMYVLELTAADRGVTYRRVLYWVKQASFAPYKAEFYSTSDRLLKTCLYQDYRAMMGRPRPAKLVMQDATRSGEESVLEYSDMRAKDLPDRMFGKDYLKHLQ